MDRIDIKKLFEKKDFYYMRRVIEEHANIIDEEILNKYLGMSPSPRFEDIMEILEKNINLQTDFYFKKVMEIEHGKNYEEMYSDFIPKFKEWLNKLPTKYP